MSAPAIYAVIPAAGRSRRMGRDKLLIDVAGRTLLSLIVGRMEASSITGIAVVTRRSIAHQLLPDLPTLDPASDARLQRSGAPLPLESSAASDRLFVVVNDAESSGMIDSIRIGLRAWRGRVALGDDDAFLIAPADMPRLLTADIDACIAAYRVQPGQIVIARHAGKAGHPLIFPAALVGVVESPLCDAGLNALPAAHSTLVRYVERPSDGVQWDVDTPSDLPDTQA